MTRLLSRPAGAALAAGAAVVFVAFVAVRPAASRPESAKPSARQPWTTSKLVGSPELPPPYKTVNAFPNIKLEHPLLLVSAPGSDRLFVAEQAGKIFSFKNDPGAKAELFFDTAKEIRTLNKTPGANALEFVYGLVFHPQFEKNRYCFVCYTVQTSGKPNLAEGTRVSRFTVTNTDPPRLDPASEEIVFTFLQGGHNGGDLHFGNDGYLYISTGDGAGPNPPDPLHTGQDITDLLSSILRIDVDHKDAGKSYGVPKDNPFIGLKIGDKEARPEIWAFGLRNPWRMSFDRPTGDLWVGDVGWELWEMIHKIEKGGNYGWSILEARQPVHVNDKPGPGPFRPPVVELPHTAAASITGGYVYHGKKFPDLVGAYIFGDWETRRIWAARFDGTRVTSMPEITVPKLRVVAFGQDRAGELYVVDYDSGTIHTFAKNDDPGYDPTKFPKTLGATGLFASVKDHAPAVGVYPFEVTAHQWQDYATTEHFIALPGDSVVKDFEEKQSLPGSVDWHKFKFAFPQNAALVKTISLETERGNPASRRRVETQVLHFDGEDWHGYSYQWRDDQSEADLVPAEGAEKELTVADPAFGAGKREQVWTFHSRAQCLQCHSAWSEYALGFSVEQLNRDVVMPSGSKNQLTWLGEFGLTQRIGKNNKPEAPYTPNEATKQPHVVDPTDMKAPLVDRARAYLHTNCGHCHQNGGGGGAVTFELHRNSDLKQKSLWATPTRGNFDLPDLKVVAPGDPAHSALYFRMAKFGRGRMPQLGTDLVDPVGVALIAAWIESLKPGDKSAPVDLAKTTPDAIAKHLAAVASAEGVARAVAHPDCPPDARKQVWAAAAKLPEGNVRDLFDGYLPRDGQERKLGQNPRPRAILSRTGDAGRGKELFQAQKTQCITCHKIDGQGNEVGPDLSAIAKTRSREDLLESILDPSRRVEPQWTAYVLKTHDGRAVTGLLVRKDGKEVVLRDAQNKETHVAADNVESLRPARDSLMPAGLFADLTAQQAADLLAFLANRKN
ncbi:PQQ-dependent sugar dehydrogenase [Fimbriiglobus ruber]|uniref:Cytochrome c domain-containing protein n=1 Tax=Fimbriiglobus ruber TaxID=1908690 RepID=A0A225DYP5_9BACT|nr:PQQ-dependent sugar dehydrogenase [Fimbriiglobus ruber]OWK43658.1 hypothetical protein FRUB_03257 [Fimbriiglobus ruber]